MISSRPCIGQPSFPTLLTAPPNTIKELIPAPLVPAAGKKSIGASVASVKRFGVFGMLDFLTSILYNTFIFGVKGYKFFFLHFILQFEWFSGLMYAVKYFLLLSCF